MPHTFRRVVLSAIAVAAFAAAGQQLNPQATPPTPTISVSVKRVAIDVVVKDSSGKPVTGLTQSDFKVTEDGKSQTVRTFDAYGGDAASVQAKAAVKSPSISSKLPPNTVTNVTAASQTGPLTVVLYDLLNTPLDNQAYARAQLTEFLDKRSRNAPVAIFVLTDDIHLLQGFTDDDRALKTALARQSNYKSTQLLTASDGPAPTASSNLASEQAALAQSQAQQSGTQQAAAGGQLAIQQIDPEAEVDELYLHSDTLQASQFLDRRVEITTTGLQHIAQFLSELPGRKNLIWLSGSFPAGVLPESDPSPKQVGGASQPNTVAVRLTASSDYEVVRNYSELTRRAANALNDSHTAVYPVSVKGLQTAASYSVSIAPTLLQKNQNLSQTTAAGQTHDQFAGLNKQSAEQLTMDSLADETGGHAAYNSNGLAAAALSAVDDGSTYYTLSYQPSNTKADGKLRNIKVECVKRGYTLAYRRNYFADTPATRSAPPPAAVDPMLVALRRGSPPANALVFEAHVQNLGEPAPATPRELQELSQFQPKVDAAKRPAAPADTKPVMMRHYAITYGLIARQLTLTPGPDEKRHANLEFAAMAYDQDGQLLKGTLTRIDDPIAPDRMEHLEQDGYQHVQRIGIPVTAATLRIGVRDSASKLLGSAEIHLPLVSEAPAK